MRVVIRITRMALRYRLRMTVAACAVLIATTLQLTIPQLIGRAVDHAHALLAAGAADPEAQEALLMTAGLLLAASTFRGLFTMLHNYQGEAVGQSLGYELRLAIYEKVQRLSFSYHDRVHSGDLITRSMLDVEGVRLFVNTGLVRLIVLTMLIGLGAYLLLSRDLVLGFLALSFVPVVGWRAIVTRLNLRKSWHRLQERLSVLTRIMEENLGGIRVVRAFAAQDHEMGKFDKASRRAFRLTQHRIGLRVRNGTLMTFAYFVAMGLVLLVGGQKTLAGELSVGGLTEFLAFMTILQMPVRRLGHLVNSVARATTSGERLFSVLDMEPEIRDKPGARDLELTEGVLSFEHVHFSYRDDEDKGNEAPESDALYEGDGRTGALHDVSFRVGPGETLGIIGPPGAGKSTIAHLIPRFYDVTSGSIAIDGQDIRDVTLKSLRRAVSVIQQDNFLFTAGIEQNVAYGDPWADRDRISSAAEAAQLRSYVEQLPKGFETVVGERGVSLSGGQRQRLAIARSVLLQPAFMVFDDSTAAIDAATEQRIRKALSDIAEDRATIIISHRLSSLMHADEILFIEHGEVVERGTHEELLGLDGKYRALYELQSNPGDDRHLQRIIQSAGQARRDREERRDGTSPADGTSPDGETS